MRSIWLATLHERTHERDSLAHSCPICSCCRALHESHSGESLSILGRDGVPTPPNIGGVMLGCPVAAGGGVGFRGVSWALKDEVTYCTAQESDAVESLLLAQRQGKCHVCLASPLVLYVSTTCVRVYVGHGNRCCPPLSFFPTLLIPSSFLPLRYPLAFRDMLT